MAVAAYGLFQIDHSAASAGAADDQAVWSMTLQRPVRFPYITSYLAFRELPVLLELIDQVRKAGRLADVMLVDGSGILHPRRAGIATMLGIVAELPTIGVTKKRLSGTVDLDGFRAGQLRPVWVDGRQLGWALRPGSGSRKPLFISPGHRASIASCHELFTSMTGAWCARRLPGPIHFADRLSRRAAGLFPLAVAVGD
jgi:deoxyribonuclease V